jgi:putative transposase
MAISFKGAHFPPDIILMGVRWYVAYPLSYRHVEELLEERGVPIDHATIQRWVVKYSPLLEEAFHRRKRPVWVSWRMDETYIKVKGQWYYLYRAVDNPTATLLECALLTQGFMGGSKAGFLHSLQPQNRDSTRANLANTQK